MTHFYPKGIILAVLLISLALSCSHKNRKSSGLATQNEVERYKFQTRKLNQELRKLKKLEDSNPTIALEVYKMLIVKYPNVDYLLVQAIDFFMEQKKFIYALNPLIILTDKDPWDPGLQWKLALTGFMIGTTEIALEALERYFNLTLILDYRLSSELV